MPTLAERKDIVKVHLSKLKLERDINEYVQRLAELTPGYSGNVFELKCPTKNAYLVLKNHKNIAQYLFIICFRLDVCRKPTKNATNLKQVVNFFNFIKLQQVC